MHNYKGITKYKILIEAQVQGESTRTGIIGSNNLHQFTSGLVFLKLR